MNVMLGGLKSLTFLHLLARTYICAAELVTWGVGPDVIGQKVMWWQCVTLKSEHNPLPTNDTYASWSLHKLMGV